MNLDVFMGEKCEMDVMNRESVIKMAIDHLMQNSKISAGKKCRDSGEFPFNDVVSGKWFYRAGDKDTPRKLYHNVWEKVHELEGEILSDSPVKFGCVMVLTNYEECWLGKGEKEGKFWLRDFLLSENRSVSNRKLKVHLEDTERNDAVLHSDVYIRGSYSIEWEDFEHLKGFRYLPLTIGV